MTPQKQTFDLSTPISRLSALKLREVETLQDKIKVLYKYAMTAAGISNFDVEKIKLQVAILEKSLLSAYGGVTIEELKAAIERGSVGEYGEFMGVNPKTIMGWVKSYTESHERKEALRARRKEIEEPKPKELTKEEKRKFWDESKAYFKETGILKGEIVLFKIGRELGLIDLTDDIFKEEVKYKSLKWFKTELKNLKEKGLKEVLNVRLVEQVIEASEDERSALPLYQNRCKRIAVKSIFKQDN